MTAEFSDVGSAKCSSSECVIGLTAMEGNAK